MNTPKQSIRSAYKRLRKLRGHPQAGMSLGLILSRIIEDMETAVPWLKKYAPPEAHAKEGK